jgi:hypothetical protein
MSSIIIIHFSRAENCRLLGLLNRIHDLFDFAFGESMHQLLRCGGGLALGGAQCSNPIDVNL